MNVKRYLLFILLFTAAVMVAFAFLRRVNEPEREPVTISDITVPPLPVLDPAQIALGEAVYARNCASCHGTNLEGQPNWKEAQSDGKLLPPPQDSSGHTWHHADELLLSIIANSSDPAYSTMRAFKDVLSEAEIRAC